MGDAIKTVIILICSVFFILTSRDSYATQVADPAWRGINQPVAVVRQIQEISFQVKHLQATGNRRGSKIIFSGPPSLDKAHSAQLLASHLALPLYRLDLASVTSKYIGETEKNLDRLFARAESGNWILLFDEADVLFGGRTNVQDSHEKYSNQVVSYLLQHIEAYSGLIIITSNNPATKNTIRHDHAIEFTAVAKLPRPPITP